MRVSAVGHLHFIPFYLRRRFSGGAFDDGILPNEREEAEIKHSTRAPIKQEMSRRRRHIGSGSMLPFGNTRANTRAET